MKRLHCWLIKVGVSLVFIKKKNFVRALQLIVEVGVLQEYFNIHLLPSEIHTNILDHPKSRLYLFKSGSVHFSQTMTLLVQGQFLQYHLLLQLIYYTPKQFVHYAFQITLYTSSLRIRQFRINRTDLLELFVNRIIELLICLVIFITRLIEQ